MGEQTSPILETDLSKDGGGFLCLELVPKASPGALTKSGTPRCDHAHLEVKLSCQPSNLPSGGVPCFVHWKLPAGKYDGAMAKLDVGQKVVTPWLELTSDQARNAGVGSVLESGGEVSITITPDFPYTDSAGVKLAKGEVPELSLTLSWAGEAGKKLGAMPYEPALRIGDEVRLKLNRTSWRCHTRLRVTAALDDKGRSELLIDFGPSGADGSWRVGYDNGVLKLPVPGGKKSLLGFTLELQVSEDDGATYASIMTKWIAVPRPTLKTFGVMLGAGVEHSLRQADAPYFDFSDSVTVFEDNYVHVVGELGNVSPKADLPFVVELWAYSPGKPGAIYPILAMSEHRAALGRLKDGKFDVLAAYAWARNEVAVLQDVKPFAILRTGDTDPLLPIPTALQHSMRLFSDEDFAQRAPGLGICSQELTSEMMATRSPLLMRARQEINAASELELSCNVCGPAAVWKNNAKFVLATVAPGGGNPRALEKTAVYAPIAGSARGLISARFAFNELDPIAGCNVTAKVETQSQVTIVPNGGVVSFTAKPSIGPVKWIKDGTASKPRLHFICRTDFYPHDRANRALQVTLQTAIPTGPSSTWIDETRLLSFPGPTLKPAVDAEGKLEAFITDPAAVARIESLLKAKAVQMGVARPVGAEKLLFNKVGVEVKAWKERPVEATGK